MNHFAISALVTAVATFVLAIFVITRNAKSRVYRIFAFYSFSITIWSSCVAIHGFATNEAISLLAAHLLHIGASLIPVTFIHFTLIFIDGNIKGAKKRLLQILYLIALFFIAISFTPSFVNRVAPRYGIPYLMYPGNIFYHFSVMFFVGCVCYGLYKIFLGYINSTGIRHNQMKYLFWGSLFGYIGGVDNYIIIYGIKIFPLYPYGTYAIAIYVGIAAYAIIKYRLMDINIAITNAAIFAVVYTLVLGIPFGLTGWFRPLLMGALGQNWFWLPMLILLGLATLGPFVFIFLQKKAEGEILKEQRHNHAILMAAAQSITLIRDFHKLLKLLVRILTKTLGIKYASIYLCDREKKRYIFCVTRGGKQDHIAIESGNSLIKYLQGTRRPLIYEEVKREYDDRKDIFTKEIRDTMNKIDAALLVPTFVADELIGFLIFGSKRSGGIYTTEDLSVLSSLANQSALAIENAQFLKEREEMQTKLREAETLTTIRDLLGSLNHEIYNLLAPIGGVLQMITMGDYDKKPEKLKSDAQNNVERVFFAKTYLGWIREYVERCRGNQVAAYQLSELVNSGISYSKDKIEKQNIKTQVNVDAKIFIVGYESLPLLFKHIIINSVYGYGMEDGGMLTISVRKLEDGNTIEIIQTDTGHDLSEYIKDGTTMGGTKFAEKGKIGGASYFIAQAVTGQHKGTLEVEPTEGKGTKFIIRLPLDFNKVP